MTNIPLRIQAGKRYRRRDGLETGSILNVKVAGYPFLDPTSRQTYSDFGCVYHSGITDGRDLVAEIPEPTPAPPEPEQTEAAPQKINDGGAAFPVFAAKPTPWGGVHYDLSGGMSLRDWFAGMALMGANASPELLEILTKTTIADGGHFDKMAAALYRQADAMLKAREERS